MARMKEIKGNQISLNMSTVELSVIHKLCKSQESDVNAIDLVNDMKMKCLTQGLWN